MANGKEHAKATKKTGWAISAVSAPMAVMLHPALIGFAVGAWLGHLITPDLDHHWKTHDEQRMRRWHPLLGWFWSAFWAPYQWTHRHRGSSHSWPLGTLVRFIYFLWAPLAATVFTVPQAWLFWSAIFWAAVFWGWSVADETHYRLDNI